MKINNERGQAVFELIVFLPLIIFFLITILNYGNSINASINQIKSTRGYLFFLLKGNSMGTRAIDIGPLQNGGVTSVGNFIVAWSKDGTSQSGDYRGSCYQTPTLPGTTITNTKKCEDEIDGSTSMFVKIFTMYGVCGETYSLDTDSGQFYPANLVPANAAKHCSQN